MKPGTTKEYVKNRLILSILEAQVSLLPRAITQAIFAQNQSPGPVWKPKTKPNLPGSIEKSSLILNAQKSELNKKSHFIDSLLYNPYQSLNYDDTW